MTIETQSSANIYEQVKRGLRALGYEGALLQEDYEFTDFLSPNLSLKRIKLATFSQDPPSYHNACFGVTISNGQRGATLVSEYCSLGTPQIFEITTSGISRWKIVSHKGLPECLGSIEADHIYNYFNSHRELEPNNISRIKALRKDGEAYQLDFLDIGLLPLLDREVQVKFDRLLTHIIRQSITKYPSITEEYPQLFRLIFRLVTAKIMADRKHEGHWSQNDPRLVIKEVENYYFKNEVPEPVLDDINVQNDIWENIRNSFYFQNLSVETLAYVYEHTLMTPEFRKKTSTHGTPPAIAEYIVRHLPVEDIEENERYVFEPFAGHAVFLVAALRRLRELLPSSMTSEERHAYFINMLSSLEFDDFAREVARIMLNNADYPNPNGWHLHQGDVFQSSGLLDRELSKSNIVLCNPPFEDYTPTEKAYYKSLTSTHKPVEILNRVLKKPPKLLGFVLPRVFISGRGYKEIRQALLNTYSSIEVLALPDNVFRYSSADTILLLAYGNNTGKIDLTVGQVYKRDLNNFYSTYEPSYAKKSEIISDPRTFDDNIWLPELSEVWDALSHFKTLGDYASEIHRGIEYNFSLKEFPKKAVAEDSRPNFTRGLRLVSESLEPFFIHSTKFLNIDPKDMRGNAYKRPWGEPKIIVNAFRKTVGHWRIMAAADYEGLYCTQYFDGIWLKEDVSLETIAAILNSPLANAYISDHKISARENNINVMRQIPIPNLTEPQQDRIKGLVDEYGQTRLKWFGGVLDDPNMRHRCLTLIKLIDGEILKACELPNKLEYKLLDYFTRFKRPIPVEFNGYHSGRFQSDMKALQDRIYSVDLSIRGTPEERAAHQIEIMQSLKDARKRANMTRLGEN